MGKRSAETYAEKARLENVELRKTVKRQKDLLSHYQTIGGYELTQMLYGNLSHAEMAYKVIMLDRRDMDFMAVIQGGRDRIIWLANQVGEKDLRIKALEAQVDKVTKINTETAVTTLKTLQEQVSAYMSDAQAVTSAARRSGKSVTTQEWFDKVMEFTAPGVKVLKDTTFKERSFQGTGENDGYHNTCIECGRVFQGNKHFTVCKVCSNYKEPESTWLAEYELMNVDEDERDAVVTLINDVNKGLRSLYGELGHPQRSTFPLESLEKYTARALTINHNKVCVQFVNLKLVDGPNGLALYATVVKTGTLSRVVKNIIDKGWHENWHFAKRIVLVDDDDIRNNGYVAFDLIIT